MKKRNMTALISALAVSAGLLAGCGGSSNATTAAPTSEAATEAVSAAESSAEETTAAAAESESESAAAASAEDAVIRVGALKGPTSMGLVNMMDEHPEYSYTMETAADAITAGIVSGDLDIALVPANLASVLYNKTQGGISVIDINTTSVLYIVSSDENLASMKDLAGKTVYLTGKGTTPDYVLQYLLAANDMSADDVTLEYKSEATEVASVLAEDPDAIGLLPQPFVTAACMQNDQLKVVLSLEDEWEKVQSGSIVTGVTIVRNEFLSEHQDLVDEFLAAHEKSAYEVNDNPAAAAEKIVELGIVAKQPIAEKAIPMCGITCITGDDMKASLSAYLEVLHGQAPESVGGTLPADDFYYGVQ